MASTVTETALENLLSLEGIGDLWEIPYDFLRVINCNADEFARFSNEIWLKFKIESDYLPWARRYIGISFSKIYKGIYTTLLKANGKFENVTKARQRKAVECLQNYMKNLEEGGNHFQCLKKMERLEKMKSECGIKNVEARIQAVLANHLFSPLLVEGFVIVDRTCYKARENNSSNFPEAECPFCQEACQTGNTNFGCKEFWHGRADIVVKSKRSQQSVKVILENEEEHVTLENEDENEEQGQDEPVQKKSKYDDEPEEILCSLAELSILLDEKSYKQAISQTIVNAFLAVKKHNNLENKLIPSFFVSQKCIFINFYNVKEDVLLVQSRPFNFFDENGVNYSSFLSVWMALNFEIFSEDFDENFYKPSKKSGFQQWLLANGILEKYQNEVDSEFYSVQKPKKERSKILHIVNPHANFELIEDFRKGKT